MKSIEKAASWRDLSSVHTWRALILPAIGALIGLIIAGFGLFTAKGTSTLVVPAEYVALVNQQPVSRIDFVANLEAVYATDLAHATAEQRRKVLDDMIREELLVQRGRELDVASVDPEVRAAIVNSVEQQAAANAMTEKPSDTKLRAYFDAHVANFATEGTMTVRDLTFGDAGMAAKAAAAMKGGQSPDDAIAAFGGHDLQKTDGDEFYFAAKIHLGDALFNAALTLPTGGVSAPIEADGHHVLVMVRNTPPVPFDFEGAKARVLDDYRRDGMKNAQTNNDGFLRKRANILIAEDLR